MPRPGSHQSSEEGGSGFYLAILFVTALGAGWFLWPMAETAYKNATDPQKQLEAVATHIAERKQEPAVEEPTLSPADPPTPLPTATPYPTATPRIISIQELKTVVSPESFWVLVHTEKEYELTPSQDEKWKLGPWEPTIGTVTIRYQAVATVLLGVDMDKLTIKQDGEQLLINAPGPRVYEPVAVVGHVTDIKYGGIISPNPIQLPDFAQANVRKIATETVCASDGKRAQEQAQKRLEELVRAMAPELTPIVLVGEPQC